MIFDRSKSGSIAGCRAVDDFFPMELFLNTEPSQQKQTRSTQNLGSTSQPSFAVDFKPHVPDLSFFLVPFEPKVNPFNLGETFVDSRFLIIRSERREGHLW